MLKKSNGRKMLMCMSISMCLAGTYTILLPQNVQAYSYYNQQKSKSYVNYGKVQPAAPTTITPLVEMENPVADHIISIGEQFIGKPYKFGAKTGDTSQFDASSFTQYVYGQRGIKLPRKSVNQAKFGKEINKLEMQKGDLLYFNKPNHVAIYMGNGKMLNARSQSKGVAITPLDDYWKYRVKKVRRLF